MPEFHSECGCPANDGYPQDTIMLVSKLYELISIFGASEFISDNFRSKNAVITDPYSLGTFKMFRDIEYCKISEDLLSIAAIVRNNIDSTYKEGKKFPTVGSLDQKGKKGDLGFVEACNKIIHANHINFDLSKIDDMYSGFLKPKIYLYGSFEDKKWKASINIIDFCKEADKYI